MGVTWGSRPGDVLRKRRLSLMVASSKGTSFRVSEFGTWRRQLLHERDYRWIAVLHGVEFEHPGGVKAHKSYM